MSASLVIREMHIKAIMRYPAHLLESPRSRNLTPPDAGAAGTLIHGWRECKMARPLWKAIWQCLIKLNTLSPHSPAVTLRGIYPRKPKTHVHLKAHTDVSSRFVHNCQTMEATRCPWGGDGYINCGPSRHWTSIPC